MLELVSIKEYCKMENITDAGARKRVVQKLAQSVKLGDTTYIVIDSNKVENLKAKLKDLRKDIKILKEQKRTVVNQDDYINELKTELKEIREKKDGLYEKVIGQYDRLFISHK